MRERACGTIKNVRLFCLWSFVITQVDSAMDCHRHTRHIYCANTGILAASITTKTLSAMRYALAYLKTDPYLHVHS